jgi:LemA protein
MTQLEGTENRIAVERRRYNDAVTEFNKTIRVFPNNVINNLFLNFEEKERFESVEGSQVAPEVDLSVDDETDSEGPNLNETEEANTDEDSEEN